jgi:ribosome-binding ATPase YchF (GTP1/OBG family)
MTAEKDSVFSLQLEEREKTLLAAEAEMNALSRRVQGLKEYLEKKEEKLVAASATLDKAGTSAEDSERAKKVFQKFSRSLKMKKSVFPATKRNSKKPGIRQKQQILHRMRLIKKLAICESEL